MLKYAEYWLYRRNDDDDDDDDDDTHQLIWTAYLTKHCWGHVSSVMLNLREKNLNTGIELLTLRCPKREGRMLARNCALRISTGSGPRFVGWRFWWDVPKPSTTSYSLPFVFVRSILPFNCDRKFLLTWHDPHTLAHKSELILVPG